MLLTHLTGMIDGRRLGSGGSLGILISGRLSTWFLAQGAFRVPGVLWRSGLQRHMPQRESQVDSILLIMNKALISRHSHFPETHKGQPIFKEEAVKPLPFDGKIIQEFTDMF